MSKYKFRFFVDYVNSPLWAGNKETFNKFDNPAYLDELPISKELAKNLEIFASKIDAKYNGYTDSLKGSPELESEKNGLISQLKSELGPDFEIVDEMV